MSRAEKMTSILPEGMFICSTYPTKLFGRSYGFGVSYGNRVLIQWFDTLQGRRHYTVEVFNNLIKVEVWLKGGPIVEPVTAETGRLDTAEVDPLSALGKVLEHSYVSRDKWVMDSCAGITKNPSDTNNTCTCDMSVLMAEGCRCGKR